jgi:ATP-dependent DNA helicase RecQ
MDVPEVAAANDLDPDEFEQLLTQWMLDRLISVGVTQRAWRVRITGAFDSATMRARLDEWSRWRRASFDAMAKWADAKLCRREVTSRHFGAEPRDCRSLPDVELCDRCSDAPHPWESIDWAAVPDPESLVSVDVVLLSALAWSSRIEDKYFSELGLKQALLGQEQFPGGRPLGRGLLGCPQFGALSHIRAGSRRLDESIASMIRDGAIERHKVVSSYGNPYDSLRILPRGRAALAGVAQQ